MSLESEAAEEEADEEEGGLVASELAERASERGEGGATSRLERRRKRTWEEESIGTEPNGAEGQETG